MAARVEIFATAADVANAVSERVIAAALAQPDLVLGVATGATMAPIYRALVAADHAGRVSFAGLRCFSLDEYIGIPARHPSSYRAEMRAQFYGPIGLDAAR